MIFTPTTVSGAYLIKLEPRVDERGHLARTWSQPEFAEHGININLVQGYTSHSQYRGTLRGLHYEIEPHADTHLVRCLTGSMYEIIVDLRPASPIFRQWAGFTLKASDYTMLLVPPSVAHGILTLEDNTEIMNFYTLPYAPEFESGIRYNDPAFDITYPIPIAHISDKDAAWKNVRL